MSARPLDRRLLHYSAKSVEFNPEHSFEAYHDRRDKPRGLWVSVEGEDDWEEWCRSEEFRLDKLAHCSEVVLQPAAKLLWITTAAALDEFTERFGDRTRDCADGISWPRVYELWDGIIIAPYQWSRRLDLMWYYGWDCASGCIWNLRAVAAIRPTTVRARDLDAIAGDAP